MREGNLQPQASLRIVRHHTARERDGKCGPLQHAWAPRRTLARRTKTLTLGRPGLSWMRVHDWTGAKNDPPGKEPPGKDGGNEDGRTGIATKTRPKTKKPSLYKVLLLNDDYTPMEFVV